jgi:hypothetical protein
LLWDKSLRSHVSRADENVKRGQETNTHTYKYTCIHTVIHTYIQTYIHTYKHTNIQAYIQTYIHTYKHAYIHTHTHTHAHTHTHTHNARAFHLQALKTPRSRENADGDVHEAVERQVSGML